MVPNAGFLVRARQEPGIGLLFLDPSSLLPYYPCMHNARTFACCPCCRASRREGLVTPGIWRWCS